MTPIYDTHRQQVGDPTSPLPGCPTWCQGHSTRTLGGRALVTHEGTVTCHRGGESATVTVEWTPGDDDAPDPMVFLDLVQGHENLTPGQAVALAAALTTAAELIEARS